MSKKSIPFVHLHNHSEYSLLEAATPIADGKGRPSEMMKSMAKMGYTAMGLTDHGNMFGAIDFYRACKGLDIKPVLGMEACVAPKSRFDKDQRLGEAFHNLTLLAINNEGFQNLLKLSTAGYLEGFYYKPRIDKELLERHKKGLIVLSGDHRSEIYSWLRLGKPEEAENAVKQYLDLFGKDNFYMEMMDHGLDAQKVVNPQLISLAQKFSIPLVATNDCRYLYREDHLAHDVLLCIGTGKKLTDEKRYRFHSSEYYYKSPEEMAALFADYPEALSNTVKIADQANVNIDFDQLLLPHYMVPDGHTPETYLKHLCMEGLKKRVGSVPDKYETRLNMELGVIERMGFSPYFLIVWDFIHYARENRIPVGPGRGSGAGSLTAFSLEITSIDPIKNGLLFERFLNPDRRSMPDLDIDFSDEGRDQVIQYVRQKYGESCVAQIITFGSMLARGVVRDVGRVLDMPLPKVDRIANMIPRELGITIDGAMTSNKELRDLIKTDEDVEKLIDLAKKLEGLKRHTGVHAAGTVIAAGDITRYVPLSKNNKDIVTTQFDGETLGKLGLLKVDFLGLRTLTVIRDAVDLIRERHDPQFDAEKISFEDEKTYGLLSKAQTSGVFQLESSGMRDLLRKLKPQSLGDITALISLYRPGPMGSGMLDEFVARRNDPSKIKYLHALMKPILEETHGVIVYQEQVMKISRALAGFTPGQADGLRKAMGKKIMEELEKQRAVFIEGAEKNNIPQKLANTIFDLMAHFGGYGFNKSHASAYAYLSYQTAYLKANYPVEYMAALCTNEIGRSTMASKEVESKLVGYLGDCKDMGIEVLPPNVQKSRRMFTVESSVGTKNPQIRFGLMALKNVGEGAVESIVASREQNGEFQSLEDFCSRVDTRLTNKRTVESLIKGGAFDGMSELPSVQWRPTLLENVESALSMATKMKADVDFAKESLFGEVEIKKITKPPKVMKAAQTVWTESDLLTAEKDVLGLYLSGHPLSKYRGEMATYITSTIGRLPESSIVRVAGHILSIRRMTTKNGNLMAKFVLEDLEGECDILIFPKLFTPEVNACLVPGNILVIKGRVETREGGQGGQNKTIIAEEILTFEAARHRFIRSVIVSLPSKQNEDYIFHQLKEIFGKYPGSCRVNFLIKNGDPEPVMLETKTGIKPTQEFVGEMEKILGPECCAFGKWV